MGKELELYLHFSHKLSPLIVGCGAGRDIDEQREVVRLESPHTGRADGGKLHALRNR